MPSSDVVQEMRLVAKFEELSHTPLLAQVVTLLRTPGGYEKLEMSRNCSNGQLLRELGDQKSPSKMLRSLGLDLSTAVKVEANLQFVISSTAKPMRGRSMAQQLEAEEANRGFKSVCCRCCVIAALVFATLLLLTSLTLLGVGLWKELEDWDLHFMDQTIEAMHFFIGSIGAGSLSLLIVVIRLMALCCRCGRCCNCCSKCCRSVRKCCLCRCRQKHQFADEEEEDVPPELSALQVAALRQISRQQLSPQLSDHVSGHLSEHLALANSPYQSPQAGESYQNFRLDELAVCNMSEAPAILHSPNLGSTVHSGFKSVSFDPAASDLGTTVVTASPKSDCSIMDPGSYAWHSPNTHSFGARFMGVYEKEKLEDPKLTEEEKFKLMAEKMRAKKQEKVTFPQYADDVVGNPVAEMETFRKTSRQFYIDTMFQSDTAYPDYYPGSVKSIEEQKQLRAMATAPVVEKPPALKGKPFKSQRPVSCLSATSTTSNSTGLGNELGLTAPATFRVGTSDPPMLSPASTTSKGRFPGQFPYRPQPRSDEPEHCLRRAAVA